MEYLQPEIILSPVGTIFRIRRRRLPGDPHPQHIPPQIQRVILQHVADPHQYRRRGQHVIRRRVVVEKRQIGPRLAVRGVVEADAAKHVLEHLHRGAFEHVVHDDELQDRRVDAAAAFVGAFGLPDRVRDVGRVVRGADQIVAVAARGDGQD